MQHSGKKLIGAGLLCAVAGLGSAIAADRALAFSAKPDSKGAKGGIELLLPDATARTAGPVAGREVQAALDGFLEGVRTRDCDRALSFVDTAAYRLKPSDYAAHCARMFASFDRFGRFSVEPFVAVSDTFLVPLRPASPGTPYRVLPFKKIGGKWLFSEGQDSSSLVPLVLTAFRAASTAGAAVAPMVDAPLRSVTVEDKNGGKLTIRLRLLAGATAAAGPAREVMAFYQGCIAREGQERLGIARYLDCLEPAARAEVQKAYDAASVENRAGISSGLTARRAIDFVVIDGATMLVYYTETDSGRRWRDIIYRVGPSKFTLENPMKSGAVDMALNGEAFRAAVRAQPSR